jgi:hypothetical protein
MMWILWPFAVGHEYTSIIIPSGITADGESDRLNAFSRLMVVKQVKQWFVTRANAARWRPIQDWADSRGGEFQVTHEGQGFQIEAPKSLPGPLRIEWGEPQRHYINSAELRMRCELRLHGDLQMMVLDNKLMDDLEKAVFEAYTDTLKTRVDTDTPEEMRWLVMFPKFTQSNSKLLRQHYGVVGVHKELAASWIESDLGEMLVQASQDLLPVGVPFVLMCTRGNLYLRCSMPEIDLDKLQAMLRILECAALEANRVNSFIGEGGPWPTTMTTVNWQTTRPGGDVPPR